MAVLAALTLSLAALAAETGGNAELADLINSSTNPVPIMPITVPQLRSRGEVTDILAAGNLPTLFQISQASGQYADPTKVRFFQMLAVEYPLKVNFRKVAAGSAAARSLYDGVVTKPVYLLCVPAKKGAAACAFINESSMAGDRVVKQTTIENFIDKRLGIAPAQLRTFPLTPANVQSLVFEYRPDSLNPPQTARWIVVLFFPEGDQGALSINRLRVLIALERFFYANRLRIAECDLSTASDVYRLLIQRATNQPIPNKAELWLIDPSTHHAVKYAPKGSSPQLAALTQSAFQAWLAQNGVARPPDSALDVEAAWHELARLERQTSSK